MKQNLMYLEDSYIKECRSKVLGVKEGRYAILDNVLFYPKGGGQPHDTGIIEKEGEIYNVVYSGQFNGIVSQEVDKEGLDEGAEVICKLNWNRRYKIMKMHTAAHILASIFYKYGNAKITGNQLGEDKSRFDFSMEGFDRDKMQDYVNKANDIIEQEIEVKIYSLTYEDAMKINEIVKLASAFPPAIKKLRIVEIPGVDIQADAGTHVKNTKEIGKIEVVKLDNKGKNNKRIYFRLI